jgi:hypothetical protein
MNVATSSRTDERILELGEKLSPAGTRLPCSQLVSAMALEPGTRLGLAQAKPRVRVERSQRVVD